jgi:hypothetical protein
LILFLLSNTIFLLGVDVDAQRIQTPRLNELATYGPVRRAMDDVGEFAADPKMGIVAPTAARSRYFSSVRAEHPTCIEG